MARLLSNELPLLEDDLLPIPEDPVIEAYKKDVDRTLLRENLYRSVEERLLNLMSFQRFADELRGSAKRLR